MTPEQQPHRQNSETAEPDEGRDVEPSAIRYLPGHESMSITREIVKRLSISGDKLRVLEATLTHGSPFAAYLTLTDVDPADPRLVESFKNAYIASYETLDQFIDDQLEDLGWNTALADFRIREGIGEDVLHWDRDALVEQIREMFDIRDLDGYWHLFAQ